MAVFDMAQKAIVLKVVYYGCALGGKTTNLETLHRLTDPIGRHGLVSIATKDDRTLFFDLLPMELGQIGGLKVKVKVYTVPGQVHYELTRRQVLSGTDGVVFVADSSPEAQKANIWALENLRMNLKAGGLDPEKIPVILQWNKRDLPDARPVADLERELNTDGRPAQEAVATTGAGVVETFGLVLKGAIRRAYAKAEKKVVSEDVIDRTVDESLEEARSREPSLHEGGDRPTFEHRVDNDAYRDEWADRGRDRQILDQETLLTEAVQTGMELAEKLHGLGDVQEISERRAAMIEAIGRLAPRLADPRGPALPDGLMTALLKACGRVRGSILLFKRDETVMDEREVVPEAPDPLNHLVSPSVGSAAFRLCQGSKPRFVEDLHTEVFFDAVPHQAESLASCFIVPLHCDGLRFGALVAYGSMDEHPFEAAERQFWAASAVLIALSLHWRGIRRKLTGGASGDSSSSSGPKRPMVAGGQGR